MGGEVFGAGELEDRQRAWLEVYEGGRGSFARTSANLSTSLLTAVFVVFIALCTLKRLRNNKQQQQ